IFIDNLLRGKIDEQLLQRVKDPINLRQYTLNKEGKIQKKSFADMVIPFAFAFILMITIFTSSGYLLQGIVEEKENRIIEILLSSVTPRELLAGKIIGLGSAGLVQITFWLTAGSMGSIFVLPVFITPSIIAIALIYFALGFLFYASLMAGVGAISNSMREGQQLASIFSITSIIPLVLMNYLIEKPDSTIAIALSIIPFTAPITSMIRVAVTQVPLYQLAISIVILAISTYFVILLSAKVFRMGLLMYGKRPTIREILRYV
ncbi:MAG: ABC transporter permease, partial [Methanosarcinales archaeon]